MTLIAHLSDLHVMPAAGDRFHGIDPLARARRAISTLYQLPEVPRIVFITGDLSDRGEPASYRAVCEVVAELERLGSRVVLALGNHDDRAAFRRVVLGQTDGGDAPWYHSTVVDGLQVIVLDSSVPGVSHGALDDAQLAWLAAQLAEPAPAGRLVALHHPPPPCPVRALGDGFVLRQPTALATLLHGCGVHAVLAGHVHMPSTGSFAGVPVVTAPALAYAIDPLALTVVRGVAASGFALGWLGAGSLVTTPVWLATARDVLFEERPTPR